MRKVKEFWKGREVENPRIVSLGTKGGYTICPRVRRDWTVKVAAADMVLNSK